MRKLINEEYEKVYMKLTQAIGDNKTELMKDHDLYLHGKNVFYVNNSMIKKISSIPGKNLIFIGTHIGRFTKSNRFFLKIGCLNVLSKYAIRKVWIKWSAEMNFLYGNNVLKSHILKASEDIGKNEIVFLYNPKDVLLGFGITTRDSHSLEKADHNCAYVIRQSDKGEYLREEQKLF